jgi:fructokinase
MTDNQKPSGRPVIFGEVLFDSFPDGRVILGGAPFNVAWHLQGLGLDPLLITRVGKDANGEKVLDMMQAWGMDTRGVQISEAYPTGRVQVSLQVGQPSYEIVSDQAYDHIDAAAAQAVVAGVKPALVYHGSLALRNEDSRQALDTLLDQFRVPVFLDLNLRAPWYQSVFVNDLLHRATWAKLNDEELCEVTGHAMADTDAQVLQIYATELFQAGELERLIVTRGEHGAFVVSGDGLVEGRPVLVTNLVDTVGAGDAFSAISLAGILRGGSIRATLDHALDFASQVCQQRGATADNPSLYPH